MDSAALPENTRKQVLAAALTGGVPPADKAKTFAAPLVGETLTKALEEAVDTAKQQVLFQQQSDILKPASSGFKAPKPPAQQKQKVPKQRVASPVVPPSREPSSGSPGYGQQGGQGGKAKSQKKPPRMEKKSPKDKSSPGKKDRGGGRGKP